jgi:hypothetical protein
VRARFVRAGFIAVAVFLVLTPTAQARVIDGGSAICITHSDRVASPRSATPRDVVRLSGVDRLTRWIANHPRSAGVAAIRATARAPIAIPVAFHVIRKDLTAAGGNVPLSQIKDQMKVLNASYGGATGGARTGFTFDLGSVDRTTSAQWFHMTGNGKDKAMKTALKVGGPETLNIYSTDLGNTLLGYAYLAQDAAAVGVLDGVVIHYGSLPGGPFGALQPGRHRDPRGRPLARPAPHVPGRVHRPGRLHRRHARGSFARLRVPDRTGFLPGDGARPDPELHGLHLRQLHG